MKTKTILKALAVALLMPAMLLTTACSSDDNIIDSEKSANTKGYALPVTVNVTRQGDEGTRATYTDNGNGTGSLAFSTGDQLFVQADNSPAGKFAGLLDYDSEKGKFSGTIMTQNAYSGTADALLAATSSPFAALVPAGYGNYNFFTIYGEGTYNAFLSASMSKTFALTKKDAVEQFSHETATSYSSGFALAPKNGIASFTISGLTASTEVTVVFSNGFSNITKNVMTNASGVATFAVGMSDEANFNDYTLTVDGNNIALPTKTVEAGHIYNISRSAAPAVPAGALNGEFTINSNGDKFYFSKGNLRYTSGAWSFFDNQWEYYPTYSADSWDKFGWSTSATTYGMNTSTSNSTYSGDFKDWGDAVGSGWRTLTSAEWTYVFNTRTTGGTVFGTAQARYAHATINTGETSVNGMILFPDGVDITAAEVTTAGTVNATSAWATKCTTAQWSALAAKGCVFLPAAGGRNGTMVIGAGSAGNYWSSSPNGTDYAYYVSFGSGRLYPADYYYRYVGRSVRLVRQVE